MIFNQYAQFYDFLYSDKDYSAECDFIETIFSKLGYNSTNRLLDLGCGTGGHALLLAQRGYHVTGIDRSEEMLEIAKEKAKRAKLVVDLHQGDICHASLGTEFDAVLAMFAVVSYQTSNADLISTFKTARRHLTSGGLFLFDGWFGPSVLTIRPTDHVKMIRNGSERIIRLARPSLDILKHLVQVDYTVLLLNGDNLIEEVSETHLLRYFFVPEVDLLAQFTGFELIHSCPFAQLDRQPTEKDWNVSWILRAI
ncbi:MAG: hypothetical protein A2Z14_18170 [Chloroflexi bacterium RBG_16_48_8]|nr:MAG: hypothetical protein A2Z14_18170 [Chloroflexi bacterium RBG_16_48_8]